MTAQPAGTATFLFSDIESSTRLDLWRLSRFGFGDVRR